MIKVKLCILGNLRYNIDFKKIENWKSKFFSISEQHAVRYLPVTDIDAKTFSDKQILKLLKDDKNYDIILGIIYGKLEGNYYLRPPLSRNKAILSLYETAEILLENEMSIESFIIKNIYVCVLIYLIHGRFPVWVENYYPHEDLRNCLFDSNYIKRDIVHSMDKTILCDECIAKLSKNIPREDLKKFVSELKRIKKPLYLKMKESFKKHPLFSLLLGFFTSILTGIVGCIIYEFLKRILHFGK